MNSAVLLTGTATGMSGLLGDLGTEVTQVLTWVGNIATTITGQPLLLLGVGFFVLGGSIGIFGRMLGRG